MIDTKRLFGIIDEWGKEVFPDAYLKEHANRESYRYGGAISIFRFWKSPDGMLLEASIKYSIDPEGQETERVTLLLDADLKVVGFDLTELEH